MAPNSAPVDWTYELVDQFVQAYFDCRGSMLGASRATGVPFRAAVAKREHDVAFADRLQWADLAYQDVKRAEQQRRVMEDTNRVASMIFDLKSTDPLYKPIATGGGVKVNIAFIDKAFGSQQAMQALPGHDVVIDAGPDDPPPAA